MQVTILLTTYNHEKYIAQALDGVLMQETNFDYEVVVLEDCSTDRTREIAQTYQRKHPSKVRLRLAPKNQRSNRPFAAEFARTSSPFIAMLDGDDYWTSPDKLQLQVDFLTRHPECAISFHNVLRIYEEGGRAPLLYNSIEQKAVSDINDLWQYCFIAGCSPLIRKSAVGALPDWYNDLPVGDWPLFLLAAQHGNICYIDRPLGVYRIHRGGDWSKRDDVQRIESMIGLYEKLNAYFDFRYDAIVQPLIASWSKRLEITRRTDELLTRELLPDTTTIYIIRPDEELPRIPSRTLWPYPTRGLRDMRQVFASGAIGSSEASWIGNAVYRFELFEAAPAHRLLASVTVSQSNSGQSEMSSPGLPADNVPYIAATPNPVPKTAGPGKTVISWNTGDGSPGVVEVSVDDQRFHYPQNSAAALEELEQLRADGAGFLFLPANPPAFLKRYPEFEPYIERTYPVLVREAGIGTIYRLV